GSTTHAPCSAAERSARSPRDEPTTQLDAGSERDLAGRARRRLREPGPSAIVECRLPRQGHVPDVPLGIPPAEAATPRSSTRGPEELDAVDLRELAVERDALLERRHVHTEREAPETPDHGPEGVVVAAGRVQADHDAVRSEVASGAPGCAKTQTPQRTGAGADSAATSLGAIATVALAPTRGLPAGLAKMCLDCGQSER